LKDKYPEMATVASRVSIPGAGPTHSMHTFDVGTLVNVESRTWPGINKPGGVGHVTAAYEDCVDVEYVLGGKEKDVDLEFVTEHAFERDDDNNAGRVRASGRRRAQPTIFVSTDVEKKGELKQKDTNKKNEEKVKSSKKRALVDGSNNANQQKNEKKASKVKKVKVTSSVKKSSSNKASVSKTTKNVTKPKAAPKDPPKSKQGSKPQPKDTAKTALKNTSKPALKKSKETEKKTTKSLPFAAAEDVLEKGKNQDSQAATTSSAKKRWSIGAPRVLKSVYQDMSNKAASFVQDIVGRKGSAPSSPDSTSSLQVEIPQEREKEFDELFSNVVTKQGIDSIEVEELTREINNQILQKDKVFTELETRSQLQRLDKINRVMVQWDTNTVYVI